MAGYCSEDQHRDRSFSGDSSVLRFRPTPSRRIVKQQSSYDDNLEWVTESMDQPKENGSKEEKKSPPTVQTMASVEISVHQETPATPPSTSGFLPTSVSTTIITTSCSADTLNSEVNTPNLLSGPSSPSNLSSVTLVGSTGSGTAPNENRDLTSAQESQRLFKYSQVPSSPLPERKRKPPPPLPLNTTGSSNKENKGMNIIASTSAQQTRTVEIVTETKPKTETVSSKPTIVSAITKSGFKETEKMKIGGNALLPNMSYLSMNRRPSTGTIGVPVAALTQHRRSLQVNSSEGGFGLPKVIFLNLKL